MIGQWSSIRKRVFYKKKYPENGTVKVRLEEDFVLYIWIINIPEFKSSLYSLRKPFGGLGTCRKRAKRSLMLSTARPEPSESVLSKRMQWAFNVMFLKNSQQKCFRTDSNRHYRRRRPGLYPLSYGSIEKSIEQNLLFCKLRSVNWWSKLGIFLANYKLY